MVTPPVLPQGTPQSLTQAVEYAEAHNDMSLFDKPDTYGPIKQFLLRYFVNQEVKKNEQLNVLTDVTLYDMQHNYTIYGHNEDTEHFAASINKLPVTLLLIEDLQAGRVTLDTQLNWAVSDRRAGNGTYDQDGSALTGTVREVLHDMLNRSGNTAVRILVNKVLGGGAAVNARLAAKPELQHTRLIPVDADRFYLGNTTSKEALWTLRTILAGNSAYSALAKEYLATNIFVEDGVRSQLAGNDYIVLANKTGLLYDPDGNNHHDVGIIYNTKTHKAYGYSFLTTAPSDSAAADTRAMDSVAAMGRDVLRFAGDKPAKDTANAAQPHTFSAQTHEYSGKILY